MNVTSISGFRKNTRKYLDEVVNKQEILVVTRGSGESVVVMSLDMYNAFLTQESAGRRKPRSQ